MPTINEVAVPLDGSARAERALEPARSLAAATGAKLHLMTAMPLVLWHDRAVQAEAYLEERAAQIDLDEIKTTVHEDQSVPQAIVALTREPGTIVCMSTHGYSGLGQLMLGSVAADVLRETDHPVMLVGPALRSGPVDLTSGNLMISVDGSKTSEAVVPAAEEIVATLRLRVYLAQVLDPRPAAPPDAADASYVRDLAHSISGPDAQWEVLHGDDPADALLDYARRLPATMIAMSTHGRIGLARIPLGSVAMRVVHESQCPVLVRRPAELTGPDS